MKRLLFVLVALAIAVNCFFSVSAAEGKVTYSGDSGRFIFAPGSEYSPTDLFPNFKDVMPGDTLTQQITVKNDASNKVKVKIYMRSLGAHEDSVDFLSQLHLTVQKSQNNEMAYMFDAQSNETAQLTEWVCLGTLYSGGEVNLDVVLDVPVELDNTFKELVGYLDWEFMIEEFPIEESDPKPPQTSDDSLMGLWISIFIASTLMILVLIFSKRKAKQNV